MATNADSSRTRSPGERPRRQAAGSVSSSRGGGGGPRPPRPGSASSRSVPSAQPRPRRAPSDPTGGRRSRPVRTAAEGIAKPASRSEASVRAGRAAHAATRRGRVGSSSQKGGRSTASRHQPGLTGLLPRPGLSLRELQRKLKRALATPQARRILAALLGRRLPGPLRALVEGLGDPGQRGFLFWWSTVTLIVALALALLLSIVLAPVTGLVTLVGLCLGMGIRKGGQARAQRA